MTFHETAVFSMQIAGLGLLWAASYLTLARVTPLEIVPGFLHPRVLKTRWLAPYVAAASLFLLVGGSIASLYARS